MTAHHENPNPVYAAMLYIYDNVIQGRFGKTVVENENSTLAFMQVLIDVQSSIIQQQSLLIQELNSGIDTDKITLRPATTATSEKVTDYQSMFGLGDATEPTDSDTDTGSDSASDGAA